MTYLCRVCKKELTQFDDIVWRCRRNETHSASIIVKDNALDFEHILIYHEPDIHYGFEFNYLQNSSQISKVQLFRNGNGDEMPAFYERSTPIYNQSGILEVDFDNLSALLDKIEKMETFS